MRKICSWGYVRIQDNIIPIPLGHPGQEHKKILSRQLYGCFFEANSTVFYDLGFQLRMPLFTSLIIDILAEIFMNSKTSFAYIFPISRLQVV
jgi:hypothetical protein